MQAGEEVLGGWGVEATECLESRAFPVTLSPFPRWEQPGQAALSGELCQGLSLPQWRLRWVQAQGILQQLCR